MAEYINNNTNSQVSWTLAQHLVDNMSNMFQRAANAYIDRNYSRYFDCLLEIKQSAVQSFTTEERRKLTEQENKILIAMKGITDENIKFNHQKIWIKINNNTYVLINEYRTLLMDCLQKHGYLNPEKADRTKLVG